VSAVPVLSNTRPTRHGRSCATATVASIRPGPSLRRSTPIRRVGFSLARAISRASASVFGVLAFAQGRQGAADPGRIEPGRAVDRDPAEARLDDRDPHRARGDLLFRQEGPHRAVAGAQVGSLQRRDRRLQVGEAAAGAEVLGQDGIDLRRVEQGVAFDAEALHFEGRVAVGSRSRSDLGCRVWSWAWAGAAARAPGRARPRGAAPRANRRQPAPGRGCAGRRGGERAFIVRRSGWARFAHRPRHLAARPAGAETLVLGRWLAVAAGVAVARRAAIEQARVARREQGVDGRLRRDGRRRRRGGAPAARSTCR
jgi:hypothetical protein